MGYKFDMCVGWGGRGAKNSEPHPVGFKVQMYITWGSINCKLEKKGGGSQGLEVLRNLQKET